MISFEAILFLVASILTDGDVLKDSRLIETLSWITVTQSLLEKAPLHNFQARRALKAIDPIRAAILAVASPTSNVRQAPHIDIDPEMVRLAELQPIPGAAIDGLSTDMLSGVLDTSLGRPEVDLLNDENFVDRVQTFLDSVSNLGAD